MEIQPDTIKISASQREEIQATQVDMFASVKGSSLASGNEAFIKAKEVSQLVEELNQAGLPAEAIQIMSIHAELSSGALLSTSTATYYLRIRCEKLEQFAELFGIITSQKSASLDRIEWKYPDDDILAGALEQAIQKAQAKAQKTAAALGVKLLGVYSFEEKVTDQEPSEKFIALGPQSTSRAMGVVAQPDLGIDIQHSKKVEVRVFVEYRVSGFPEGDTIRDLLSKPANGTGTQVQVSDNLSQA